MIPLPPRFSEVRGSRWPAAVRPMIVSRSLERTQGGWVKYVLAIGSLYGSPARVRDQVAELRDAGVQHPARPVKVRTRLSAGGGSQERTRL